MPTARKPATTGIGQLRHDDRQHILGARLYERRPAQCRGRSPHAQQDARRPDEHDEKRVQDDHVAEGFGVLGGHPMLEKVGEHSHGQRHEKIGQEFRARHRRTGGTGIQKPRGMALGHVPRRLGRPAQLADDEKEDDAAQDDEHRGVDAVGERQAAHAAAEDIDQHHYAHRCGAHPLRHTAARRGKQDGKRPLGDRFNGGAGADDVQHHVGNHPADENGKEDIAQERTLKAIAEELDLRAVAETFAVIPEFGSDEEEAGRVDQAGPRRHLAVDADAAAKSFVGAADQGERAHRRAEDRHHQQERTASAAGQKIIDRRVSLEADAADQRDREQDQQIAANQDEGDHKSIP